MKTVLWIAALLSSIASVVAFDDSGDLLRRSDDELAAMLSNAGPRKQRTILTILIQRYRLPGQPVIDGGIYPAEDAYPRDRVVSPSLISGLVLLANNQTNAISTRTVSLHLMRVLLARTNIVQVFENLLPGSDLQIRLDAAWTIVQYANSNHLSISPSVVSTLAEILTFKANDGQLIEALNCTASLRDKAEMCAPAVLALTKHRSRQVRTAARDALKEIERKRPREQ